MYQAEIDYDRISNIYLIDNDKKNLKIAKHYFNRKEKTNIRYLKKDARKSNSLNEYKNTVLVDTNYQLSDKDYKLIIKAANKADKLLSRMNRQLKIQNELDQHLTILGQLLIF